MAAVKLCGLATGPHESPVGRVALQARAPAMGVCCADHGNQPANLFFIKKMHG